MVFTCSVAINVNLGSGANFTRFPAPLRLLLWKINYYNLQDVLNIEKAFNLYNNFIHFGWFDWSDFVHTE